MSSIIAEATKLEYSARQPWPEDAQLFQPYEASQILLAELASCLSVRLYLKMTNLKYKRELRPNAEQMSPSGKVPFIKVGNIIIAELDPIVSFVRAKGIDLSKDLSEEEKIDQKAFMALLSNTLTNVELYLTWLDADNWQRVTRPRYGHPFPWPLNHILPVQKRYRVKNLLTLNGWASKTVEEVYAELETVCEALSEKLGDKKYFFAKGPTELDALVFGHLYTLLTVKLPANRASAIVCRYGNLVQLCRDMEEQYFKDSQLDYRMLMSKKHSDEIAIANKDDDGDEE